MGLVLDVMGKGNYMRFSYTIVRPSRIYRKVQYTNNYEEVI